MKKLAIAVALVLLVSSLPVHSKSPCKKQTIEDLVKALGEAYSAKDLGRLDTYHPYLRRVRIVIRHSLGEGDDEYEVKQLRSLKQGEQWLRSRGTEDFPGRGLQPLLQCKRGVCTYDFSGGIVHRVLFLKKITYGYNNGCPYIKTIYLLDGD